MTDRTNGQKRRPSRPLRRPRIKGFFTQPASRLWTRWTEHPRLDGCRSWLDRTTTRLERWEQKLPAPLKNPVLRRRVLWGVLILGSIGGVRLVAWQLDRSLPDPLEVKTFMRRGTLSIKAADGSILHQLGPASRDELPISRIPRSLINAFVASEDRRFLEHHGVDYQGIVRAIGRNLTAGGTVEGGSTLTQQLARIVYLNQDHTMSRKLVEAMIAQKMERQLSKQDILDRYLNLVYLGSNAYGVADAAWIYFSKSLNQLTLSEMATIAGLPPAPSVYSPLVNLKKAQERRNTVLDKMLEAGYITAEEAGLAKAEPLIVKPSPPKNIQSDAPYFTDYVQQNLAAVVPKATIEAGGLTVETTLNAKWQTAAEKAVRETIEWDGPNQGFKQAALVAIDPRNGEIRSMVGGYDFYKESQFNRATQAQRQPGSTFKPFVYATAIGTGMSPYRDYLDERFMVDGYQPKNFGNKYSGWMSLKTALTNSVNVVAVKVLMDVGFDPVIRLAQGMGIQSKLAPTYAMALGAYEVNLLELTGAYGSFAARGNAVEAHGIRRVLDRRGQVIYSADYQPKRVLDPESTAIITWLMRGVVTDGTGRPAQLSRPVAGKTGTSEKARDLWFIGFIPQVVAGVWLGNDDNSPTYGNSGTAALTWHEFMKKVVDGMPEQKFPDIPQDLDHRKGTIKAQPVKTGRLQSLGQGPDPEDADGRQPRSYEEAPPEPAPLPAEPPVKRFKLLPGLSPKAAPPPVAAPVKPPVVKDSPVAAPDTSDPLPPEN